MFWISQRQTYKFDQHIAFYCIDTVNNINYPHIWKWTEASWRIKVFLPKPSKSVERLNIEDRKMRQRNVLQWQEFWPPLSWSCWCSDLLHDAPQQAVEEGEQQYEMWRRISWKPPSCTSSKSIYLLQKKNLPELKILKKIIISWIFSPIHSKIYV